MLYILLLISTSFIFSSSKGCLFNDSQFIDQRSIYSIGDTISIDDQNLIYPVCNEGQDNDLGATFQFSDLNGDVNGGHYKITIISMNATW